MEACPPGPMDECAAIFEARDDLCDPSGTSSEVGARLGVSECPDGGRVGVYARA